MDVCEQTVKIPEYWESHIPGVWVEEGNITPTPFTVKRIWFQTNDEEKLKFLGQVTNWVSSNDPNDNIWHVESNAGLGYTFNHGFKTLKETIDALHEAAFIDLL